MKFRSGLGVVLLVLCSACNFASFGLFVMIKVAINKGVFQSYEDVISDPIGYIIILSMFNLIIVNLLFALRRHQQSSNADTNG